MWRELYGVSLIGPSNIISYLLWMLMGGEFAVLMVFMFLMTLFTFLR